MLEQTTEKLMTLDEFIAEYHKQPFELVSGEKRLLMPNVMIHQLLLQALFLLLHNYAEAHHLGKVMLELPFVESYTPQWVKGSRTPDIMFFSVAKWEQYTAETENWLRKPSLMLPDLAIEIVSPNDSYSDLREKIEEYLAKEIRLIWIFDPQRKRVEVYAGEHYEKLTPADLLKGGDVFPGLEIRLSEVFQ